MFQPSLQQSGGAVQLRRETNFTHARGSRNRHWSLSNSRFSKFCWSATVGDFLNFIGPGPSRSWIFNIFGPVLVRSDTVYISIPKKINLSSTPSSGVCFKREKKKKFAAGGRREQINYLGNVFTVYKNYMTKTFFAQKLNFDNL